ncbi:MAG: hypothetical protein J3R72DRAFT_102512 [Linnemannia gamsii]|nr:MAG: hypothetical protein J3R72DRAFT_102512 [Linnemannia gamsii]
MLRNTMADNLLTLFCLVDGDSVPFSVDIDTSKTVDHLKDAIKTKKAPRFDDVAADELTLWRVSIPLAPKKDCKDISLGDVPLKEELNETDDQAAQKNNPHPRPAPSSSPCTCPFSKLDSPPWLPLR